MALVKQGKTCQNMKRALRREKRKEGKEGGGEVGLVLILSRTMSKRIIYYLGFTILVFVFVSCYIFSCEEGVNFFYSTFPSFALFKPPYTFLLGRRDSLWGIRGHNVFVFFFFFFFFFFLVS
ncbi:hypothetical protein QBC42DRAFT_95003 [Cladorrhinum samala]|uniref:Uncharacterized protein n=1 Tax=Cladorrhinum samala TaxID=585594 RepID=A0AAV9HND4_9PEZI|nr:hypothetical protein QBC42DRAFT_95003 [Cladorrhinum samala]